jgi:hypothetical protein
MGSIRGREKGLGAAAAPATYPSEHVSSQEQPWGSLTPGLHFTLGSMPESDGRSGTESGGQAARKATENKVKIQGRYRLSDCSFNTLWDSTQHIVATVHQLGLGS